MLQLAFKALVQFRLDDGEVLHLGFPGRFYIEKCRRTKRATVLCRPSSHVGRVGSVKLILLRRDVSASLALPGRYTESTNEGVGAKCEICRPSSHAESAGQGVVVQFLC